MCVFLFAGPRYWIGTWRYESVFFSRFYQGDHDRKGVESDWLYARKLSGVAWR